MYQGPNKQSLQEQLQESPQDIQSRVDSPWRASPDATGYNEQTTKAIQRLLKLMEKRRKAAPEKGASSMGVLLLGEAGMGKTHLLMRVAQSSDFPCSMAFIRRPNNEDAVMRHIWSTMFEDLRQLRSNEQQEETTQLEEILLRAIAAVTIWQWQRQQQKEHNETRERRIQKAKRDPYFLKPPLTHPKNGAKNRRIASKKLRAYFSRIHPKADCNVIDALLKYTFEEDQDKKNGLSMWLDGQQIEEDIAAELGVPDIWFDVPEESSKKGIIQHKEEQALRAIRTVGILCSYSKPLVLACDQLEGLRDEKKMTRRWGDVMREMITETPNLLILTCIFPSLWKDWFSPELDASTIDRISDYTYQLEDLTFAHAKQILAVHLSSTTNHIVENDPLFPFEEEDLQSLYKPGITPRHFLKRANQRLNDWLFDDDEDDEPINDEPIPEPLDNDENLFEDLEEEEDWDEEFAEDDWNNETNETEDTTETTENNNEPKETTQTEPPHDPSGEQVSPDILEAYRNRPERLKKTLRKRSRELFQQRMEHYETGHPNEEALFGQLRLITNKLIQYWQSPLIEGDIDVKGVLPSYKCYYTDETDFYVAVCNASSGALTSRLKNMHKECDNILLARDKRCKQKASRKAMEYIHGIQKESGEYYLLPARDHSHIYTICDLVTEIQQRDLLIDDEHPIQVRELFRFLQDDELLYNTPILREINDRIRDTSPLHTKPETPETPDEPPTAPTSTASTSTPEPQETPAHTAPQEQIDTTTDTLSAVWQSRSMDFRNGPSNYVREAAEAIREEYIHESRYAILQCTHTAQNETIPGLVTLTMHRALPAFWQWEGSKASKPKRLPTHNQEQVDTPFEDNEWSGAIIGANVSKRELYLWMEDADTLPQPGTFLVKPFLFNEQLHKLYTDEGFRDIQHILPAYLQKALDGQSSPRSDLEFHASTSPFKTIWSRPWSILWGPPGTGKTHAIGEQVAACMADPKERILVISSTNQATDQVALRIAKELQKRQTWDKSIQLHECAVRIGKGTQYERFRNEQAEHILHGDEVFYLQKISETQEKLRRDKDNIQLQLELKQWKENLRVQAERTINNEAHRIVVTTVYNATTWLTKPGLSPYLMDGLSPFTTIIIDEAGVVPRSVTAVLAILASKRVVLVGDPMQLSPITRIARALPTHVARWQGASALDHISTQHTDSSLHQLTTQYRMQPSIREVISGYRYDSSLKDAPTLAFDAKDLPEDQTPGTRAIWYVLDTETQRRTQLSATRGPNSRSWQRNASVACIEKLLSTHPTIRQLSGLIVSPFLAHVEACQKLLQRHDLHKWRASTVHSEQGAEADVVIFDTVHAGSHAWPHNEWLRLVNVALSRARQLVVLIATESEMLAPFLAPLRSLLAPCQWKLKNNKGHWQPAPLLQETVPLPTFDQEDMSLLGNQLRRRATLRSRLSHEQELLCARELDGKPRLVRGVAGSGKTVVLAHWLCQTLENTSQSMHTIWVVFGNQSLKPMLLNTIQRAWDDRQAQQDNSTPLPMARVKMFHIKEIINLEGGKYTARLKMKSNDFEYDRASHKILEFLDSRRIPTMATCDAMFLDEAQDFGPNTLRFLSRLVRQWDPEDTNSKPMMIFYDNAQNVYDQQPPSWTELGLDMRGRSAIMKESFRSTKPISEFAINVLNQLSPFNKKHPLDSLRDDPDFKELEKLGLISEGQRLGDAWWRVHFNQIDGPYPTVHLFDRIQDEMEAISEQLSTWIRDEAVKPQQIKLLYMSDYTKNSIERFIKPNMKNIGVNLVIQKSESYTQDENALIATTPHSFKGYDAEIVVLVSVHNYATTSGHYFTPALYVAMTRARSILSIYGRRRKKNDNAATIRLFEKLEQCASQQLVNDDNLELLKQLEGTKIDHTGNTK